MNGWAAISRPVLFVCHVTGLRSGMIDKSAWFPAQFMV
ncbi:hypothetical protein SAMN05421850_105127 [Lutimaribacter saemankumensis]|uniref:Uncharacterized protein n=1 Tax=Lutimaribacter saemankumensis TaxID=490829 RepID=A0A1G8N9T7_9RHOB|nr:hypothetical protein SAMN05421850_105127 [Lutimaribacter saemankumensis]